jgi:hypothetical protein
VGRRKVVEATTDHLPALHRQRRRDPAVEKLQARQRSSLPELNQRWGSIMNYKQSILSAAIVASLSFAAQLHAQETAAAAAGDATDLDRIVVTGIRGSIEKSLDVKREAKSHVEVVTAEDIGKMPTRTWRTRCSACRASPSARPVQPRAASTRTTAYRCAAPTQA